MNVSLEDVLAVLKELEFEKSKIALVPNENVYKQYALIGSVDGVKSAIRKLEFHFERERLSSPQ